jgi:hypothetical protein
MTRDEVIDLLSLAAAFDRRKPDGASADAWHLAVGDLSFDDAKLAVVDHYRESSEWLMPAHVRGSVKALRLARQQDSPMLGRPPADPGEYAEWLKAERKRIADGTPAPRAIGSAQ